VTFLVPFSPHRGRSEIYITKQFLSSGNVSGQYSVLGLNLRRFTGSPLGFQMVPFSTRKLRESIQSCYGGEHDIFSNVTPSSLIDGYRCFQGIYCLNLQGTLGEYVENPQGTITFRSLPIYVNNNLFQFYLTLQLQAM
jgi:hypothetical protein